MNKIFVVECGGSEGRATLGREIANRLAKEMPDIILIEQQMNPPPPVIMFDSFTVERMKPIPVRKEPFYRKFIK